MLELTREEMRELGRTIVEMMIEHFATLRDKPASVIVRGASWPPCSTGRLRTTAGGTRGPGENRHAVFANLSRVDPPRFFALSRDRITSFSALARRGRRARRLRGSWMGGSGRRNWS